MPRNAINLGRVRLPDEAVTQTFAILGQRGSGKTTTGRVLGEQLLDAGLPLVAMDPTGVWWGFRSSADGKAPGYPVIIFGGEHGDVPLEENTGHLVADVIVGERIPAVLDMSMLTKSATRRFAIDFLERLYHRNREPLHVIIDEADLFAPQRLPAGAERLLGAMDDLVRRGRVRGLGCSLITQRPAVLNKDVLSQVGALIALRMIGKRDVEAINEWVALHADEDEAKTVKASLPSLPVGTAWIWSPGWLSLLERVDVQRPVTFDSSATPKPGERRRTVRTMADVDIAALGEQIAAAVDKAKTTDPKHLWARIRRLEAELAAAQAAAEEVREPEQVPVLSEDDRAALLRIADDLTAQVAKLSDRIGTVLVAAEQPPPPARPTPAVRPAPKPAPKPTPQPAARPAPMLPAAPGPVNGDRPLGKAERAILNVLAQQGTRTKTQISLTSGYSHKSSTFNNALSSLRSRGFITGYGDMTPTREGLDALGPVEPLPTGQALREWWKSNHLGKAERVILDALADAWPGGMTKTEISEAVAYSAISSTFNNALSRLRSLELAAGYDPVVISDTLMEER